MTARAMGAWIPAWVLVPVLLSSCGASHPPRRDVRRVEVAELRAAGLSGSASDEQGRLWAVAERDRCMYRFERVESDQPLAFRVPLEGVPESLDLESIAWIGPGRLAIGTEEQATRDADLVLWAELVDDHVRITGSTVLSWRALFGIEARPNQGIEGLCFAAGFLLAGGEPVIRDSDARWAPMARRDLRRETARETPQQTAPWVPFRLRLSSAEGKLSSLDCTLGEDDETLDVFAIERHFGVTRILRFELPLTGAGGGHIVPSVVADLSDQERMPNMEGLSRRGARLLILTDHDSVALEGSTETILIGPLDDD